MGFDYNKADYTDCLDFVRDILKREWRKTLPSLPTDVYKDAKLHRAVMDAHTARRGGLNGAEDGDLVCMRKGMIPYVTHVGVYRDGLVWHWNEGYLYKSELSHLCRMRLSVSGVFHVPS